MSAQSRQHESGFSIIELVVSLTVLLVIAGASLTALSYAQRISSAQQMQSDMHAGLRGTFALMSQEIGQAGSLNFTTRTTSAAITGSSTAQTVALNSTANIFVGELLTVGTGSSQEAVTVTAVTSTQVTGIFKSSHASGSPVFALGVFPQGIMSSSTSTSLKMFGDMNSDGTLSYVEYNCDPSAGTFTRSTTNVAPGTTSKSASQVLLTNLTDNPGGTPCFQYASPVSVTVGSTTYTFVPSVAVSLTVQTSKIDPQTGQFVTLTKSFSNLAARNVLMGITLAQASPAVTSRLQSTPPNLPYTP